MAAPTMTDPPANMPSRNDPSTFSDRADAAWSWLNTFFDELGDDIIPYIETIAALADGGTYNVQSSATDSTAGRILLNAAFGLGGTTGTLDLTSGDDLDALNVNGWWRYQAATTGSPNANAGVVWHMRRLSGSGTGYKVQMAYDYQGSIFVRYSTGAGWGSWKAVAGATTTPEFQGLSLDGYEVLCGTETIADNAVATITPPKLGGIITITANGDTAYPLLHLYGKARFDAGDTLLTTKNTAASGSNFNVTTGTLTGTTGSDNYVTFSALSAGTLQIENRGGSSIEFSYKIEG